MIDTIIVRSLRRIQRGGNPHRNFREVVLRRNPQTPGEIGSALPQGVNGGKFSRQTRSDHQTQSRRARGALHKKPDAQRDGVRAPGRWRRATCIGRRAGALDRRVEGAYAKPFGCCKKDRGVENNGQPHGEAQKFSRAGSRRQAVALAGVRRRRMGATGMMLPGITGRDFAAPTLPHRFFGLPTVLGNAHKSLI